MVSLFILCLILVFGRAICITDEAAGKTQLFCVTLRFFGAVPSRCRPIMTGSNSSKFVFYFNWFSHRLMFTAYICERRTGVNDFEEFVSKVEASGQRAATAYSMANQLSKELRVAEEVIFFVCYFCIIIIPVCARHLMTKKFGYCRSEISLLLSSKCRWSEFPRKWSASAKLRQRRR
jgi:hypothetical protein